MDIIVLLLALATPFYFLSKWLMKRLKLGTRISRRFIAIVSAVTLSFLLYMGIFTALYFNSCKANVDYPKRFSKEMWDKREDGHYHFRRKMGKDVIENHLRNGMTYCQVVGLLGKGDYGCEDSLKVTYEIKVDYFGVDPVKIENLVVEFTSDSLVEDYYLTKWRKGFEQAVRK